IQRIFLGAPNPRWAALPDMDAREKLTLVPLAVLRIVFGLFPKPLLDVINAAMTSLVTALR
ncbi:MAG: NADH-quinone oxidoreductase subunit M, partial [bacterium]